MARSSARSATRGEVVDLAHARRAPSSTPTTPSSRESPASSRNRSAARGLFGGDLAAGGHRIDTRLAPRRARPAPPGTPAAAASLSRIADAVLGPAEHPDQVGGPHGRPPMASSWPSAVISRSNFSACSPRPSSTSVHRLDAAASLGPASAAAVANRSARSRSSSVIANRADSTKSFGVREQVGFEGQQGPAHRRMHVAVGVVGQSLRQLPADPWTDTSRRPLARRSSPNSGCASRAIRSPPERSTVTRCICSATSRSRAVAPARTARRRPAARIATRCRPPAPRPRCKLDPVAARPCR